MAESYNLLPTTSHHAQLPLILIDTADGQVRLTPADRECFLLPLLRTESPMDVMDHTQRSPNNDQCLSRKTAGPMSEIFSFMTSLPLSNNVNIVDMR